MSENNLPIWRQELKSARKKEGKIPSSKWIQLATVNSQNMPRLRTVVFRGWEQGSTMIFFTDKRSEKIEHLQHNSNAEILWFFFKSKTQFRFKGTIDELIENGNYWDKLSNTSKSTWFWDHPGRESNPETKSYELKKNNLYKPNNFLVLQLHVQSVDMLKLEHPIHKRYSWEKANKWKKVELNP